MDIGVCFGSFTEKGWVVRVKNENCSLHNDELLSMIEYSAVLYQHGEFERLYGPFPQTTYDDKSEYKWNFVSFSFLRKDLSVQDSRLQREGGITPTLLLIIFPKQYDSVFILCKDNIVKLLNSIIKDRPTVVDIDSSLLSMISHNISNFVSIKLQELEKPEKILGPDDIFGLPKVTHPTVLVMIHIQRGSLEDIAQETEYDLHTTEEHLNLLIESGYVKKQNIEGKSYYYCSSE